MQMQVVSPKRSVVLVVAVVLVVLIYYQFAHRNESDSSGSGWTSQQIDWDSIPKRALPPKEELHDKWIVLTTINPPTSDVKKLASIEGWKVVVVGDTKSPKDWSHPNCVFLDIDKQKALGYKVVDLIPFKTYARKNIGYLYAIEHGAKIIYETDDDNAPTSGKVTFYQKEKGDFLVYHTKTATVNPYEHFGQSTIWPRGYPLENISDPPQHSFVKCGDVSAAIQQGVVDGDPDVDAIFRLTRKDRGIKLDVKFDPQAPAIALPIGTLAPFNSQNTLFHYNAFWAFLLPVTTAFRVCDIWRGYWAQRLLWEIGGNLAFFGPNAVQVRSAHNYLLDFIDEKALYHDAGRLVNFLIQWKSDKKDFFSRVQDLSNAMVRERFWDEGDAKLTVAWLSDLVSVGYKPPKLESLSWPCKKVNEQSKKILTKEQPSSYLRTGDKLKQLL